MSNMHGKTVRRLALFLPSLVGGGAERVILNLSAALVVHDYPVDLVLQCAEGFYLSQVPAEVRLVDLRTSRMLNSLRPLADYLRRERPTALLAAMMHTNGIAIVAGKLARVKTRIVISEHVNVSTGSRNSPSLRGRYLPHIAKKLYPYADSIIAVSNGVADDLAATLELPRERIRVIYNPVVGPELLRKALEPLDHPWFKAGEPPVLLAVGRLTKQKDFPTLLRSLALVRKQREVRLVILGEGDDRAALVQLAAELGLTAAVNMPGLVQNPYNFMARTAVFVLSSLWEGLPTVLIEAMACGARVISTDCPSGPAEILRNRSEARLVPVGNVDALATAILDAIHNRSHEPEPVADLSCFSMDTVVQQYINELIPAQAGGGNSDSSNCAS